MTWELSGSWATALPDNSHVIFSNFKMTLGLGSSAKLVIPVVNIRKVIIRMGIDLKLIDLW